MLSYIFDVIVLELDELIGKGMTFNHTNFHDSTSTRNQIVELVLDIIDRPSYINVTHHAKRDLMRIT